MRTSQAIMGLAVLGTALFLAAKAKPPSEPPSGSWDQFNVKLINFPRDLTTGFYLDFCGSEGGSIIGRGVYSIDYSPNFGEIIWQRAELEAVGETMGGSLVIVGDKVTVGQIRVCLYGFPAPVYREVFGCQYVGRCTFRFGYKYSLDYNRGGIYE